MAPKANSSALTQAVISILVKESTAWTYAYDLARHLKTRNGTVSNVLNRLERKGWLESKWETRRKLFKPTTQGLREFETVIWGISPDREGDE
jgi:DNA-binding PadR family transcriptional regulator